MENVHKRFGATYALRGVDFTVYPGEVVALVGENGAGKSTLMKVLSGAVIPDEGKLYLDGKPFIPRSPLNARMAGVAMIYQELSLTPHLTVMEYILLGVEPAAGPFIDWKKMRTEASKALAEVGVSDIPLTAQIRQLPPAKQQQVEIARAVALEAKILVFDEPTSSLTQQDVKLLFDLIKRLKARNLSIVYISHFLEEVKEISDRVVVLRDGKTVGEGPTGELSTDRIVALMVGREIEELYPRSRRTPGEVVLEIKDLAGTKKPQSATLQLRRGEVIGIAGLVGAGRTELMRAIFGLDPVKRGEIKVFAYRGHGSPYLRWKQKMGMVSEDRKGEGLAFKLSVAENIVLPNMERLGAGGLVFPSRILEESKRWIDRLDIRCGSPLGRVSQLSGGNQQKVAVARLLHADADILLLDEPTRGIDVGSKAQIYKLIDELAKGDPPSGRKPKAILMVSSYLPELLGICDRIAVMCRGRLSEAKPVSEWDEHSLMLASLGQN